MIECKHLPSDIHLYLLDARHGITPAEAERLFRFADSERKEKIIRKRFGREETLLADVLRQYALYDAFGLRPERQRIAYGAQGKPFLADEKEIFFNYSHSAGMILCAAAKREVGADIQKIKPYNARLAERICSEAELAQLDKAENRAEAFCRIWTAREAAAKLYGTGLFVPHPDDCFLYTAFFADYILSLAF